MSFSRSLMTVAALVMASTAVSVAQVRSVRHLPMLAELCKAHSSEPACAKEVNLTEDEAFVLLMEACGSANASLVCKEFRATRGGVLIFDAEQDAWEALWHTETVSLEFDIAGVPTLRLKPREALPLKIVVNDISPLTYSAAPGTPTEEDLAVIAGLKTFFALAGTGIQGVIQTVAYSPPRPLPVAEPTGKPKIGTLTVDATPRCEPNPEIGPLWDLIAERNLLLLDLNTKMRLLSREIEDVEAKRLAFVRSMQRAEDRHEVKLTDLLPANETQLRAAFTAFETAVSPLAQKTNDLASCQPLLAAYTTLLSAPPDLAVVERLVTAVNTAPACTTYPTLQETLRTNAARLAACGSQLETTLKLHGAAVKPLTDRLLNARTVEEKVWQAVSGVASSKNQVLTTTDTLNRNVQRGQKHTWRGTLVRQLVVTRQNPKLPWNKKQTHSVVIKADSPYAKEVTLAFPAEMKRDYRLESATGQILGYGIGVIYTPLREFTWTAVAPPGQTQKVITPTKTETRAGDLAAFLTYRFAEHWPTKRTWQPTLDFGVGLTSDRAAFFVGPALEIKKIARIGVGWAPQRISMLDGQKEGDAVSSNDDIRTIKRFDRSNWYLSFSFALDSLSLFNRP